MSNKQQIILITGASSGIGHASAMALIKEGHIVYGAARRVHLMDDLVAAGGHAIEMDVTDDAAVQAGVDRIISEQGRIDGLFANAGYCLLGAVENLPIEEVTKQFDTNVVGVGRAIKAVLPHMRAQGGGTIAICSSGAGHVSSPGMAWYPATKFALQGLGDEFRMELKPFGINVTVIEPGYIATSIDEASLPYLDLAAQHAEADAYAEQRENFRKNWGKGIREGADPDTIAKVVVKAFNSEKPKRRYHPNFDARSAILMKRLVGDALLDRFIPGQTIGG
jgi:NAD(P)-dependent dehydrogenase (short-subunit alcohol dehydrogenase family)